MKKEFIDRVPYRGCRGYGLQQKERRYYAIITEVSGKPPEDYTDEQWQLDFDVIKMKVQPSQSSNMPTVPDVKVYGIYHGKTQYQCYCDFINNILSNIRCGQVDYCFYIYQIAELLKYEHERLKATWLKTEGCFCLSLESK